MPNANNILIVGSGNLAWHLAPNLVSIGKEVLIWSRRAANEKAFAWQSSLVNFPQHGEEKQTFEAVFLAVPDNMIGEVSQLLSQFIEPTVPVVHTSGATATDNIAAYFKTRAALWPIRSLRKGEAVAPWQDLPLAYYCSHADFETKLANWANALSKLTYRLDDEQRAQLHLAAVFSNNFTTWLCQIAWELCQEKQIPFGALVPIIKNTFSSIDATEPALRQTGAARRGDTQTMERHLALLEKQPEYAKLYAEISALIMRGNDR
jgi:predicted short-subunit dehydrogenase-like oxidoreductase (DUF2520 family)